MIRQIFIQLSHKLQSHTIHLEGHLIEFSIGEICIGSGIELEIDIGLYLSYLVSPFPLFDNTFYNGWNGIALGYKGLILSRCSHRQHTQYGNKQSFHR